MSLQGVLCESVLPVKYTVIVGELTSPSCVKWGGIRQAGR